MSDDELRKKLDEALKRLRDAKIVDQMSEAYDKLTGVFKDFQTICSRMENVMRETYPIGGTTAKTGLGNFICHLLMNGSGMTQSEIERHVEEEFEIPVEKKAIYDSLRYLLKNNEVYESFGTYYMSYGIPRGEVENGTETDS